LFTPGLLASTVKFQYDDGMNLPRGKNKASKSVSVNIILMLLLIFNPVLICVSSCAATPETLKIGVLLPLMGPDAMDSQEVLDWVVKDLNSKGGVGGSSLELVYKDTYNQDINNLAQGLVNDPSIPIVIGPQKSSELRAIAPLFIKSQKLLISPTATSADISRAYGQQGIIWRTCQSDVAQVRSILYELASRGVTRLSLIYSADDYGKTFLEWTGFFCTELGIDLLNTVSCSASSNQMSVLDEALIGDPDYILTAAYVSEDVELKKLLDSKSTDTRMFFTDAAETPYLIQNLGTAAEGIELMSPAADPNSEFEAAYYSEYGYYPWDYAASTCDALLLSAYSLARQQSQRGILHVFQKENLKTSFSKVVSGSENSIKWNQPEKAIELLLKGKLPDISGASGPLNFDKMSGVDPTESFYSLNKVETIAGVTDFRTIRRFSSSESVGVGLLDQDNSAVFTRAALHPVIGGSTQSNLPLGVRENLRAVIISSSSGWDNYRHQSDALAVYDMLRKNGVNDKDIVLFSVDDVPTCSENPLKGNLHYAVNGANIRENAVIDYSGNQVTLDNFKNVLLGNQSSKTPDVLQSNAASNILIYIVGHGMPRAVNFSDGEQLTSRVLAQTLGDMHAQNRYRQVLILTEACYGESLATDINTPGVLFLTGAARIESSFGAVYDQDIKQWLSDDFTRQTLKALEQPGITLEDLYLTVYKRVAGSHVRMVNNANFGDIRVAVAEFIKP
jgi:glycosylphosphatidylinositol transamidase (GPIT) subunit GPI8/ABC-type branched-subunit amino acid transport system substrate-binding protein